MESVCKFFVQSCFTCQLERATHDSSRGWRGELIPPPPGPRLEWVLDLQTDLPCKGHGYRHILTAVDPFSKFAIFLPLATKSSAAVVTGMQMVIANFGVPLSLHFDNGSEFQGEFALWVRMLGIHVNPGSPYHSNM